jgi:hypothetical protein
MPLSTSDIEAWKAYFKMLIEIDRKQNSGNTE